MLAVACSSKTENTQKTIFVTITPMQAIIEEITMGDFNVEVIVPKGASPETFEPTLKQVAAISDAEFIFSTGLINFEQNLINSIDGDGEIVNLSQGVELIAGSCSHGNHKHKHGVDPHIWTSPRTLRTMVLNAHDAIIAHYPDSVKYTTATERLLARLDELDNYCASRLASSGVDVIMIYHPAYTYYARDYGIQQIAIEHDGKEPTPKQLTSLCNKGNNLGIDVIFHQPQYSADKVSSIASEIGAEVVETNPLAEDILAEIERITKIICNNDEQ